MLNAQQWKFIKERDGIRVYTRSEPDTRIKSFKGEAFIHSSVEKILSVFTDLEDTDWWVDNIYEFHLMDYKKGDHMHFYLVYDVPWPFCDRDIYAETFVQKDTITGTGSVTTASVDGVIPEKPDLVRMPRYWHQWAIEPVTDGSVHMVLEGFADPGGNIPAWLQNLVMTNTPLTLFEKIREKVE